MKILVATEKPFAKVAVDGIRQIIENAGYELLLLEKYKTKEELINAIKNADAVIVRSDIINAEIIEKAENLKIIVRAGAGYDNIDLNAASAKNIVVMNTPGQNSNAVAELAIGMMIFMYRGQLKGISGNELKGKKLGLHAFGYVGKALAHIAHGFGMEIYAYDPFLQPEDFTKENVTEVKDIRDLYSMCNIVSIHIPANEKTKKLVNYELMSMMPKNALLVNTARKEVICEDSLKRIFEVRDDFKYVTDVAPDCHNELLKYNLRYYATPKKQGAETAEANINAGLAAARQIVAFFKNGDRTFQVNK
ncbi:MAG: 3-phosphoglycerate dehydrogenase [Bacteroidales bacterium]|nr:3-phosphoglycerate dehydrogenase [Bacteroidales bacterium]